MAGPVSLVSLDDVKTHLNITDTTDDAELQTFIDAAQAPVEDVVGLVIQRTLDEWYDGGDPTILLRHIPVTSVTSVTEFIGHTPINLTEQPLSDPLGDGYGYTVESPAGIVTRRGVMTVNPPTINPWFVGNPVPFYPGVRNIRIQYVAGQATVPSNVQMGTLEVIRHAWETQRGLTSGLPLPGYDEQMVPTPSGFLIPYRAMEYLKPSRWRKSGSRIA